MAEFAYSGVDRTGKKVNGNLSAQSEGELRAVLRTQGVRPTSVQKLGAVRAADVAKAVGGKGGASVPVADMVIFTRQLYVLLTAGIPLTQALDIQEEQTSNPHLRKVIATVREKVGQGAYFWETLNLFPRVFPKLYVSLVRAGESSGNLDQMLKRLTRYLEDNHKMKKLVKGAMIYPISVVSVGIGVIGIMLVFVIPKFEAMMVSNGQELPPLTAAVIGASRFMTSHIIVISGVLGVGGYLATRFLTSAEGKVFIDRTFYRAPLFGELMKKSGTARFARTMQTLLSSGVSLLDAIDICKNTVDNAVLEDSVALIRKDVETGKTLGTVMAKHDVFPKMAIQMITVGESTGSLDQMLDKVADYYEAEVEEMVSGMSKLIEPFILVFLGGSVGTMLIAMYLPIFKMAAGAGE